jgi:hypothetical protein
VFPLLVRKNTGEINFPTSQIGIYFGELDSIQIDECPVTCAGSLVSFVQNPTGKTSNNGENNRENAETPSPSRHHLFVALVFGLGAVAAMALAFKGAECADDHGSFFWWVPLLSFLFVSLWLTHLSLTSLKSRIIALRMRSETASQPPGNAIVFTPRSRP